MLDLSTKYMGLELRSPLVVSANPLSEKIENILAMEDAGAGAIVMFSLFEEQIRAEAAKVERVQRATMNIFAEMSGFFPNLDEYPVGTAQYLELIREAKSRTDIPIIGSLNGITPEGWIEYAREIEQAGADALEINVYFIPGGISHKPEEVEKRYLDIVRMVRETIEIPIAVKLNPYFSSIGNMAHKLQAVGANALVFFNRFYQPDFDINELKVVPNLDLSHPSEIRLPLLWIAVLYGRLSVSFAATTGIHGARELIKYILAGADVGMVASTLLEHGIPRIKEILDDLELYLLDMQFKSVESFKGLMSQLHIPDPSAYERSNYIHILENKDWW